MTDTDTKPIKKPRSVKLTTAELKALKSYRKRFATEVDCALSIGVDRLVLNRIIIVGSGAPDSVEKVRAKLSELD